MDKKTVDEPLGYSYNLDFSVLIFLPCQKPKHVHSATFFFSCWPWPLVSDDVFFLFLIIQYTVTNVVMIDWLLDNISNDNIQTTIHCNLNKVNMEYDREFMHKYHRLECCKTYIT